MKPRELFQLAIKTIGFIILLQGFRNCVEGLLILKGYAIVHLSTPQYWAAWAFLKIGFGVYLMVGGTPFLNLAFPLKTAARNAESEITTATGLAVSKESKGDIMDPKVMFGLAVKTIGLILVLYGLEYFFDSLLYAMKTVQSNEAAAHTGAVFAISEFVLGLAMLRGVVPLVDFAFPQAVAESSTRVEENRPQDEE